MHRAINPFARDDVEHPSRRALWSQIVLVYGALAGALWTLGAARVLFAVAAIAMLVAGARSEPRFWPELGLALSSIRRGGWIVVLGAIIGGLILLAGSLRHTLQRPDPIPLLLGEILGHVLWAFAQQFLAQSFFFLRLEYLLRNGRWAVVVTALLFAAAHIPNPVLVPVTLVGGWVLSTLFRRHRTLYALAIAQALVSLSLWTSVPEATLHQMRVGLGYFNYGVASP
jgi:membrane protease YdiL (CAAX protease family)